MKKIVIVLSFVLCVCSLNAQIFNTSGILKKGEAAVGFQPSMHVYDSDSDFVMFLHGGVGIGNNLDVGAKIGLFGDATYVAGDIEYGISQTLSLSAGAHYFDDFGLDGTANVSIPLVSGTKLITGLDMDINFINGDVSIPVWVPIGVRVAVGNGWSMIMEAEIELTNEAYHFFGIGMAYGF